MQEEYTVINPFIGRLGYVSVYLSILEENEACL